MIPHDFTVNVISIAPGCVTDGREHEKCSMCIAENNDRAIAPIGHNPDMTMNCLVCLNSCGIPLSKSCPDNDLCNFHKPNSCSVCGGPLVGGSCPTPCCVPIASGNCKICNEVLAGGFCARAACNPPQTSVKGNHTPNVPSKCVDCKDCDATLPRSCTTSSPCVFHDEDLPDNCPDCGNPIEECTCICDICGFPRFDGCICGVGGVRRPSGDGSRVRPDGGGARGNANPVITGTCGRDGCSKTGNLCHRCSWCLECEWEYYGVIRCARCKWGGDCLTRATATTVCASCPGNVPMGEDGCPVCLGDEEYEFVAAGKNDWCGSHDNNMCQECCIECNDISFNAIRPPGITNIVGKKCIFCETPVSCNSCDVCAICNWVGFGSVTCGDCGRDNNCISVKDRPASGAVPIGWCTTCNKCRSCCPH